MKLKFNLKNLLEAFHTICITHYLTFVIVLSIIPLTLANYDCSLIFLIFSILFMPVLIIIHWNRYEKLWKQIVLKCTRLSLFIFSAQLISIAIIKKGWLENHDINLTILGLGVYMLLLLLGSDNFLFSYTNLINKNWQRNTEQKIDMGLENNCNQILYQEKILDYCFANGVRIANLEDQFGGYYTTEQILQIIDSGLKLTDRYWGRDKINKFFKIMLGAPYTLNYVLNIEINTDIEESVGSGRNAGYRVSSIIKYTFKKINELNSSDQPIKTSEKIIHKQLKTIIKKEEQISNILKNKKV